jgi:predicted phosphodiesterase
MTRIGLLSDSHSYLDEQVFSYFADCDELWHAGDVGAPDVVERLAERVFISYGPAFGSRSMPDKFAICRPSNSENGRSTY